MTENTKPETLTAAQHQTRILSAHRAADKGQHRAGLAVFAAEAAGMLTFDRPVKGVKVPEGVLTRSGLAKVLGCSGTLVSKYRGIGRLDALGIAPGHADYTFAVQSAAAAWMTSALDTGSLETVVKAIADHRPGSQSNDGGQKGKNTKGTKKAAPAAEKKADPNVTRANIEAKVAQVAAWLTAGNGQRLDAMSAESLETMRALLHGAADSVEAAQVRKAKPVTKAA